jgi:hypothetical protein
MWSGTPSFLSLASGVSPSWSSKGPRGSPSSHQPTKGGLGCWCWGRMVLGMELTSFTRLCHGITCHAPIGEYCTKFNIDGPIPWRLFVLPPSNEGPPGLCVQKCHQATSAPGGELSRLFCRAFGHKPSVVCIHHQHSPGLGSRMRGRHKARTLGMVLIGILEGLCWLLVLPIPFTPLMGVRHSGGVDGLVGTGSV